MRWLRRISAIILVLFVVPLLITACSSVNLGVDWRIANRDSAGLAPSPVTNKEAIVQVYGARAFNWRGIFAVHTWIAVKAENANQFTVYQVIGWRTRHGGSAVVASYDVPDRNWYGARPEIYKDIRGPDAQALIPEIEAAVQSYPHVHRYVLWPGPNSNSFVAHVARQVPNLAVDLPPTAIGKDYIGHGDLIGPAPSNTGFQISLFGLLGLTLALEEGIEFNVLTLNVGIDPLDLGIRLPGLGRISLL
ncbi:MAG: hypothetical protein ACI9DC_001119 [Gammaproteobacteria bacterium]